MLMFYKMNQNPAAITLDPNTVNYHLLFTKKKRKTVNKFLPIVLIQTDLLRITIGWTIVLGGGKDRMEEGRCSSGAQERKYPFMNLRRLYAKNKKKKRLIFFIVL